MVDQPGGEEKQPIADTTGENQPGPESKDLFSDIRQDLSQAEQSVPARKPGFIQRFTGFLRRKKSKPGAALPASPDVTQVAGSEMLAVSSGRLQADSESLQADHETMLPGVAPGLLSLEIDEYPDEPAFPLEPVEDMADDDFYSRLAATDDQPSSRPGLLIDEAALAEISSSLREEEQSSAAEGDTGTGDEVSTVLSDQDIEQLWMPEPAQLIPTDLEASLEPTAETDDPFTNLRSMVDLPDEDEPTSADNLFVDETIIELPAEDIFESGDQAAPALFDDNLMQPQAGPDIFADSETPPQPAPQPKKGLRGFLTGILRPDPKKKDQPSRNDIDDTVVTTRLSRSLGIEDAGSMLESSHEPMDLASGGREDEDDTPNLDRIFMAAGPLILPPRQDLSQQDRDALLAEEDETAIEDHAPGEPDLFAVEEEDTFIQAGEAPAGDFDYLIDTEPETLAGLTDSTDTIDDRLSSMEPDLTDIDRIAWEGTGVRQVQPVTSAPIVGMDDMRAILLENYNDRRADQIKVDYEVEAPAAIPEPRRESRLSRAERVMLVVLGLLIVLLVVTIGLLFMRPPEQIAAVVMTRPTGEVISGAALPTGLELPGGWYFALERNTMVEGKWKPQAAEWLENSEVPRIIAIPWNRQTEAVIQTFEVDDKVVVSFGSQAIAYQVREVKRVSVDDSTVLTDRQNALVLVLYQEDADQRWVITAK